MLIAILIIQALILLVCFELVAKLYQVSEANKKQKDESAENVLAFQKGSVHTWTLIRIALFKMWRESEILDFDTMQVKLSEVLQKLSLDQPQLLDWQKKFQEYITENKDDNTFDR